MNSQWISEAENLTYEHKCFHDEIHGIRYGKKANEIVVGAMLVGRSPQTMMVKSEAASVAYNTMFRSNGLLVLQTISIGYFVIVIRTRQVTQKFETVRVDWMLSLIILRSIMGP